MRGGGMDRHSAACAETVLHRGAEVSIALPRDCGARLGSIPNSGSPHFQGTHSQGIVFRFRKIVQECIELTRIDGEKAG